MKLPDRRRGYDEFRCEVCGKEITRKQSRIFHTCSDRKCRYEYGGRLRDRAKALEEQQEQARRKFWNQLGQKRDQIAKESGVPDPSKYLPVCVPHLETELVAVGTDRRERLRKNLLMILEQALNNASSEIDSDHEINTIALDQRDAAEESDSQLNSNEDSTLLQAACATCGGYCCKEGGETAYLNEEKFSRLLAARRGSSPESIVDDYLSKVPELACRDSCIFHGSQGCTLPRAMRSDLCKAFECYGLKLIHELITERPVRGLYIASTVDEEVLDCRFVDANDTVSSDAASSVATA